LFLFFFVLLRTRAYFNLINIYIYVYTRFFIIPFLSVLRRVYLSSKRTVYEYAEIALVEPYSILNMLGIFPHSRRRRRRRRSWISSRAAFRFSPDGLGRRRRLRRRRMGRRSRLGFLSPFLSLSLSLAFSL